MVIKALSSAADLLIDLTLLFKALIFLIFVNFQATITIFIFLSLFTFFYFLFLKNGY